MLRENIEKKKKKKEDCSELVFVFFVIGKILNLFYGEDVYCLICNGNVDFFVFIVFEVNMYLFSVWVVMGFLWVYVGFIWFNRFIF